MIALGLLLFLVVLPGGSWYYLQKGLAYQKELRKELTVYGTVPAFQLKDVNGVLRDSSIFSEKISVVAFLTPEVLTNPKSIEPLARLYDQFDKKDVSRMVVFGLSWPEDKMEGFRSLAEKYEMNEVDKCYFIADESVDNLMNNGFKWPTENGVGDKLFSTTSSPQNKNGYPHYILVNMNREIINYYDYSDADRIRTMVEHVAISIPLEKRPKPKLRREQEK